MEKDRTSDPWTTVGNVAQVLGVAVWLVYAVMRYGLGMEVSAISFLPFHLAGVIPGTLLRRRKGLARLIARLRRKRPPGGPS
jgi:hypothetical protein